MANSNYPLPKFHFSVNWGGTTMSFTEVSGMEQALDVIEYRMGNSPQFSKMKMPGLQKNGNITLKRGVFVNQNDFVTWYNTVAMNLVERRSITISLLDENHNPVVVWKVRDCFIVSLKSTDLKSDANEVAIETVEIANQGFEVEYLS
ncbi:phage tail protein [Flavobacterium coralii]|uniref:phage tail protein n=1 Tax=Flavobacterium coralii TaxID=2838017 RepID=UPI000C5C439D|nr:phage tail protein [Flavobacterium coralii]MBE99367.1 phage tail protein [Flavobacterium sp.]MBY8961772.1 phage tail protein [Flavobacterium coralii]|tara:strand:- start:21871 stop:22311 length:441 start_codon:yes stop_codon:yes gene_type:complete